MSEPAAAIRDAASLVLMRRDRGAPEVLMGQRGAAAVFMPEKFVFPGGALDAADVAFGGLGPWAASAGAPSSELEVETPAAVARALPLAAIRELLEETGLVLGAPDLGAAARAPAAPGPWRDFLLAGLRPRVEALRFFFRAVTPPGRPRRFDARFFLAEAEGLAGDPDDFSRADAELALLQWIDLDAARSLALPFITTIVLSEIAAILRAPEARRGVPFFRHDDEGSHFKMIPSEALHVASHVK